MDEWTRRIHDIMDEMRKRNYVEYRDSGAWQPATNVYETREFYYICAEVGGMGEDEIDVACLDDKRVTISGCRHQPRPEDVDGPLSVHVMEIDEGPFRREIDLPEAVKIDEIEASYNQGYLWISLPKRVVS